MLLFAYPDSRAHIVPPERLDEQTESYRRMAFLLALNPFFSYEEQGDLETWQILGGLYWRQTRRGEFAQQGFLWNVF